MGELIPGTSVLYGDLDGNDLIDIKDAVVIYDKIKGKRVVSGGYTIGEEARIPCSN